MKKKFVRNGLLAIVAVFSFAITIPLTANALPDRAAEAQEKQAQVHTTAAEKREAAQTRLADAKLKACQNREKAITAIMARIADRGQKQVTLFGKIADRTQTFYANKGKKLSNYDALVADVAAKKSAAQAAIDATRATSIQFKCDGTDPKGVASTFKEQMKTQNTALKAYKTAVKNLIVGVKSAQGTTSTTEKSPTEGNQ